jgi:hypothetical protein
MRINKRAFCAADEVCAGLVSQIRNQSQCTLGEKRASVV